MVSIVDEILEDQPKPRSGTVNISLEGVLRENEVLRDRVKYLVAEAYENRRLAVGYQKLYHEAVGLSEDTRIPPQMYANLPQDQSSYTATPPTLVRVFRWPWERKPCKR